MAMLFVVGACTPANIVRDVADLERVDSLIFDAPDYPGKTNPLLIATKRELEEWSNGVITDQGIGANGGRYFRIDWPEATATGAISEGRESSDVLVGSLTTSNAEWRFFGTIRIGSTSIEVLKTLPAAVTKENGTIEYCGAQNCAVFTVRNGHVDEVSVHVYLD